ncbi:transmembrane protein 272-like [Spea bombifrons]|uniref:transmembrane protein 272-like n=1 Tax=Spea bombifrons TaxID=233779 RepID=UPI00234C0204|nr:transmembrane protein 272-like [Spea bombifrons]
MSGSFSISVLSVSFWSVLSIAMIIMGALFLDNCKVEPKVAVYLIVSGAFNILAFTILPLKRFAEIPIYVIEGVIGFFQFCWFIAGSVWVFTTYRENTGVCNDALLKFAFWILIFQYIAVVIVAVVCLCMCCCGCMALCSFGDSPTTDQNTEEQVTSTPNTA